MAEKFLESDEMKDVLEAACKLSGFLSENLIAERVRRSLEKVMELKKEMQME